MPERAPSPPLGSSGRVEDEPLLRGLGRYTADLGADGLHARFARASNAHARIRSLDLAAARQLPDVVAVFAMADLEGVLPREPGAIDGITNRDGSTTPVPPRPCLARDRIRFAGEAFAIVVAGSEAAANDAVEAIVVDLEDLPAVSMLDDRERERVTLHDECPGDLGFDWQGGDEAATAAAFDGAALVVRAQVHVPRILGAPLEPFSCSARYEPATGEWTLITPSQGVHAIRRELADGYLAVPHERLHVVTPDVGGAFGIRIHSLPEQAALLAAAALVGRPLHWRGDRTESNLCEPHARDMMVDAELALDAEGRFLAVRGDARCNLGAYVHPGARATPTVSLMFGLQGAYRMPAVSLRMRGLYTSTTPTGPFRGAGQPEGTYVIERLIDEAARTTGIGAADLRRRNALGPGDGAHRAANGHVIDRCDAVASLRHAEDWLQARRARDGRSLEGRGIALYLKVNGMGRQEKAEIVVDPVGGTITALIGSQSNGQGHATTFAALAADRLDLPLERVRVVQGDTRAVAFGTGTGASSALGTTGTGVSRSCADLLAKARVLAAARLDTAPERLLYGGGSFRVDGSNRFCTLQELADLSPEPLVGRSEVGVTLTYTVGCHACVVAVDRDTGETDVTDYAAFDDLGPLLQPAIAYGQVHGGVVQGIGQALHECFRYDRDTAQPVSATFLDYQLPRASDVPAIGGRVIETPAGGTDLGIRGAGEAGAVASMAAVVNAVANALGGPADLQAPITAQQVWRHLADREH